MPERRLRYIEAVNEALRWSLATYPECVVFGEDVALPDGPFGATKGLRGEFGGRVFDTPISESAMVGAALGAAMRGLRPVLEIMYVDFTLVAADQILNQVAHTRYVSRGAWGAPLVIRTQQACQPGACVQHTHRLEAVFAHFPGLRVGLASNPQDAYDMTCSAVASDDPVVVIENRLLYPRSEVVEVGRPPSPLGGARVLRPGQDVTIVTWSWMVGEALKAAQEAARTGVDVEVIDLRWLNPLDFDTVAKSLERTGRLLVAHDANLTCGFGAEIAARAASDCFWNLNAPVVRVAAADIPTPAAPALQEAVIPSSATLLSSLLDLMGDTGDAQ